MTASTESAMSSRETRLSRIPLWFIEMPSEIEMVVNGTGTAPPAATPSRALSACGPSDIEHGVLSPCVLTMPTRGLPRSSSSRPQARRKARWGVRSRPSTVMRERKSIFVLMVDLLGGSQRDKSSHGSLPTQAQLHVAPGRGASDSVDAGYRKWQATKWRG